MWMFWKKKEEIREYQCNVLLEGLEIGGIVLIFSV